MSLTKVKQQRRAKIVEICGSQQLLVHRLRWIKINNHFSKAGERFGFFRDLGIFVREYTSNHLEFPIRIMTSAANLYHSVIQDVISSVRDSFRDEMADENVLQELKNLWTSKLEQSKTIDPPNSRAGDALAQDRMGK